MAALRQASTGATPLTATSRTAPPPYKPLVIRGLAVAALAALGYAGDDKLTLIDAVMAEPASAMCLNMSKLNLYQCLAVAKPHYEDVFCLGQHVLLDTGQCLMKYAGVTPPVDPRAQAAADAALEKASAKVKPRPAKKKKR
jgi:hypothetical protein